MERALLGESTGEMVWSLRKRPKVVIPKKIRNLFLVAAGVALIATGAAIQDYVPLWLWTSVQTVGVVVLSILIGLWIHDWFGGNPELRDLKAAVQEFRLGANALSSGVHKIYDRRSDAKGDIMEDLKHSEISCRLYAGVYISEIQKDPEFPNLISDAAKRASAKENTYLVSFCSLPQFDKGSAIELLNVWARREKDPHRGALQERIRRAHDIFQRNIDDIEKGGVQINVKRRFLVNCILPHSLVIIDDRIAYVSFYDWKNIRGDDAPTLRLEGGYWLNNFVEEANILDRHYSVEAEGLVNE